MQLVETVSRNVVNVQEPAGKAALAAVALFAAVPFEEEDEELY